MWLICFAASVGCIVAAAWIAFFVDRSKKTAKRRIEPIHCLLIGAFFASLFAFFPVNSAAAEESFLGYWRALLLSAFHSMQVFAIGCEFEVIKESLPYCPQQLDMWYQAWAATLFVIAPIFTFGFVLSLFKNLSASMQYVGAFFRDVYIFSQLNEKSLTLARDIKSGHRKAAIVFADVSESREDSTYEMMEAAKRIGAICFKKDMIAADWKFHCRKKPIFFFAMGSNETENLNQALKLIEQYKNRKNTHLYVFSTKLESQLLLTAVDKGSMRVRRVNEVQSLVNRLLYDQGEILFRSAAETDGGVKKICAVVVGLGRHGTELTKALTWFCQMDGYEIEIHAFDADPLAEEKFTAKAPELMSALYNGVEIPGEARYKIVIHSGIDTATATFAKEIAKITDATYAVVALGNDDININTAADLRMYFERMKIHPVVQAIVYNTQQKKALTGIKNYRGQPYDIDFIGDMESSYTENVILNSELEEDALKSHMKWGKEEEFWTYEYNYRSSLASAIHRKARLFCAIPGAGKVSEELTEQERDVIEVLEHRRWNAYMRAEGYVYSGSKDSSSRNDLAKMHHDLVDFASLTEEEKRKDSRVGAN